MSAAGIWSSVTRDDLVGQYIGHTAPKTKEMLKKAMGGVLFIDEAYYLYRPENERDYGQESIEILLQVMENQRDDLVVILAGYDDRMETLLPAAIRASARASPITSTFPTTGRRAARNRRDDAARAELPASTPRRATPSSDISRCGMLAAAFSNARSIRNALDRIRLRQANRLLGDLDRCLTREDVTRIEAADYWEAGSSPKGAARAELELVERPPLCCREISGRLQSLRFIARSPSSSAPTELNPQPWHPSKSSRRCPVGLPDGLILERPRHGQQAFTAHLHFKELSQPPWVEVRPISETPPVPQETACIARIGHRFFKDGTVVRKNCSNGSSSFAKRQRSLRFLQMGDEHVRGHGCC